MHIMTENGWKEISVRAIPATPSTMDAFARTFEPKAAAAKRWWAEMMREEKVRADRGERRAQAFLARITRIEKQFARAD